MKAARTGGSAGPILLIEDHSETRESMRALLSGAGFRVLAADDGRKALELAGAVRPVLVVLDTLTFGMNGREFLERRGDAPALSGVPVIVVTGSGGVPLRGAAAVLRKPVDPDELLSAVRGLLRRAANG